MLRNASRLLWSPLTDSLSPSLKPAARSHNTVNSIKCLSFLKLPSKSLPSQLYTTGGRYNPAIVVSPSSRNCIRGCKRGLVIVQHFWFTCNCIQQRWFLRERPWSRDKTRQCWYWKTDSSMESGVCNLYSLLCDNKGLDLLILASGLQAPGIDTMQNQHQHQHRNTVNDHTKQ